MNLYRVECHAKGSSKKVYVVAESPNEAQEKALRKMSQIGWKYTNWAGTVEVIAHEDHYRDELLVV